MAMDDTYLSDDDRAKLLANAIKQPSIPMPNGGLVGNALTDYIKANPGPQATTGLNPNNPGTPDDSDDSDEEDSPVKKFISKIPGALKKQPASSSKDDSEDDDSEDDGQPSKAPAKQGFNLSDAIKKLTSGDNTDLKAAQQQAAQNRMWANLGQAGSDIGNAISRNKNDTSFYDNMLKQAGQPVQDIKDQQTSQMDKAKQAELLSKVGSDANKADSTSDISALGRQIASESAKRAGLGIKIPDNISLSELEKIMPGIENMANKKLQYDMLAQMKSGATDAKNQTKFDKMATQMGQDLDANRARSGAMGDNQKRVNAAERVQALLNQFPDGNIPKIQTRELATSLGALLSSGSQTAVAQVNELVPHTLKGDAAGIAEWITGNPQGAQQQAFVKMYADTANREKQTAQEQIRQAQFKKAYSSWSKLKDSDPDSFYQNLSTATGLDKEEIQAMESQKGFKGQYQPKPVGMPEHPQDSEAVKWAKKNPTDPRAASILKANGI